MNRYRDAAFFQPLRRWLDQVPPAPSRLALGEWISCRRIPAALLIAALAAPVSVWSQAVSLRPPDRTRLITPAEEVWGGLATLIRDPATPLTRRTVEKALGVKLKLDPEAGNGKNVFRLPKPAKWPLSLSLGPYDPGRTRLGMGWDDTDKRFSLGSRYCVLKSDFEDFLKRHGWATKTSPLNQLAMDAPIMDAVWERRGQYMELTSAIQQDCLLSVELYTSILKRDDR